MAEDKHQWTSEPSTRAKANTRVNIPKEKVKENKVQTTDRKHQHSLFHGSGAVILETSRGAPTTNNKHNRQSLDPRTLGELNRQSNTCSKTQHQQQDLT